VGRRRKAAEFAAGRPEAHGGRGARRVLCAIARDWGESDMSHDDVIVLANNGKMIYANNTFWFLFRVSEPFVRNGHVL